MVVVEMLILGASLVGCAGCWAAVQKHRIAAEMQKHKLQHDLEVLKPPPEPQVEPEPPSPQQQALTSLLNRRQALAANINKLRDQAVQFSQYGEGKKYEVLRADALKALEDARREQRELVEEQERLLKSMRGSSHEERLDATSEPVQPAAGGPVAKRVADPGELHDVELYDEETGRESST